MNTIAILTNPALILIAAMGVYVLAEAACRRHDAANDRWRVRVWWEGEMYTHAAKSEPEGCEWASCYPVEAHVSIERVFHGRASFVAGRNVAV